MDARLERVAALRDRTLAAFPVRVWRGFLRGNGFLLSAGMGYYVLFSLFAILYVAFAIVGIWLGASPQAIDALIEVANSYIPGIIGEHGLVTEEAVAHIAQHSSGLYSLTGAIALGIGVWTAISVITFTRRAVRDIFGLPFDTRNYFFLKLRDLVAGMLFVTALLVGALLSTIAVWALEQVLDAFGWGHASSMVSLIGRIVSVTIAFIVDAGALAVLVHFLVGADLRWRYIWPGAIAGGAATIVLQLAASLALSHVPANPLLASFAAIVAMLLWCRVFSVVVLVAASWIAVTAGDHDHPLSPHDELEARRVRQEAVVFAAREQLQHAKDHLAGAAWFRRRTAKRMVLLAQQTLNEALAEAEDLADTADLAAAIDVGDRS